MQQAGEIAYEDLKQHLQPYGHIPIKNTPGLWRHLTTNLTFPLIVDDFGIKFTCIAQFKHLIHALQQKHDMTVE